MGVTIYDGGSSSSSSSSPDVAQLDGVHLGVTNFKAVSYPTTFATNVTGNSLTDGVAVFTAIYLTVGATITGAAMGVSTTGVFTGDANNKMALYSCDGTTLTKVAETANNENIWKVATTSVTPQAFVTPYVATAGLYFLGSLYNSSAQTTAPAVVRQSINSTLLNLNRRSGYFLTGTLNAADLGASIPCANITTVSGNGQVVYWAGLY